MAFVKIGTFNTANYEIQTGNNKYVVGYNIPYDFKPYSLTFRNVIAASNAKAVIYTNNADVPDALVCVSSEVYMPNDYVTFYYPEVEVQSAGNYFFGYIASGANYPYGIDNVSDLCFYNADTYADGPADPFGTPIAWSLKLGIEFGYFYGDNIGVSKTISYQVLSPPLNVAVSKTVAYMVLDIPRTKQANMMVIT